MLLTLAGGQGPVGGEHKGGEQLPFPRGPHSGAEQSRAGRRSGAL